jgi:hypothetical protein
LRLRDSYEVRRGLNLTCEGPKERGGRVEAEEETTVASGETKAEEEKENGQIKKRQN